MKITMLLLISSTFGLIDCTEVRERADEKSKLLNDKAEKLDSVIHFEMNKVEQLDSMINKEIEKIYRLDSVIENILKVFTSY